MDVYEKARTRGDDLLQAAERMRLLNAAHKATRRPDRAASRWQAALAGLQRGLTRPTRFLTAGRPIPKQVRSTR